VDSGYQHSQARFHQQKKRRDNWLNENAWKKRSVETHLPVFPDLRHPHTGVCHRQYMISHINLLLTENRDILIHQVIQVVILSLQVTNMNLHLNSRLNIIINMRSIIK
jgi:hypothetical protein